jgi:hypothetical protein
VDPESGHPYYYHEENDESTYDRPASFQATVADPFASARSGPKVPAGVLSVRRDEAQKPVSALCSCAEEGIH